MSAVAAGSLMRKPVSLAASGSNNSFPTRDAATDSSGSLQATLASITPETKTVTATAAGVPLQQQALRIGFRPANPDVPLLTNDADNPFNKYKDAGLTIRIPRTVVADTPSGDVLNRLMTLFGP